MIRRITAVGIVALLLFGIVKGIFWLEHERFFEAMGWVGIFLAACFTIGLLPVLYVLRRHRHQGVIVLWCRRFGKVDSQAGARNRWMWAIVSEACRGFAFPVTLRDASVEGSQAVGRPIQTLMIILGIVLGIPLWLALYLWISGDVDNEWDGRLVLISSIILYIGMFVGIGSLASWVSTSFAATRGDPQKMYHKLLNTKHRRFALREMEVVRCVPDNWKKTITIILQAVDLVIIDSTESTDHLSWEIELTQGRLGNENVLFISPEVPNGSQSCHLNYDLQRANDEIKKVSQEWGDDDYGEGRVDLGSYGRELVSQLRDWIYARKGK